LKSRYAFIFDSEGDIGRVILKSPTQFTMNVAVKGRAAHAGIAPEKGINSIRVSSEIIGKIPNGRIDDETTVNVGVISGGQASNIVPEETNFELEVRSMNIKKLKTIVSGIDKTIRAVSKKYGAKPLIVKRQEYSGFSISRDSAIVKIIDKSVRKIGLTPVYEASGGGSDTNIINRAGIHAINLSIGMRKVHTRDEFIMIKDLVDGARLTLAIIETV
jgi:tripeptide aminopeptidase